MYNIFASVDTIGNLSGQRSLRRAGRQPVSSTDFGGKPANSAAWAARDTAPRGPGPPFLARRRATARAAKTRVVAGVGMMRARWSPNVDGNGGYNGRRIVHGLPALLTSVPAAAAASALLSSPYPYSFSYCQPFFLTRPALFLALRNQKGTGRQTTSLLFTAYLRYCRCRWQVLRSATRRRCAHAWRLPVREINSDEDDYCTKRYASIRAHTRVTRVCKCCVPLYIYIYIRWMDGWIDI